MKSLVDKNIKINTKDRYAYWALIYLLTFLVFSGYVEFRIVWHIAIIAIGLLLFKAYPKECKTLFNSQMILLNGILISILILSTIWGNGYSNVLSNVRSMLYSLFSLYIIAIIMIRNDEMLFDMLKSRMTFFNVVLILNTIIVAIQAKGTGFMIKSSWLASNPYYDDQVAGLFGFNSTNQLGMYTIFVALLNMAYAKYSLKNQTKKRILIVYTILMIGLMAILSKYNDNAGYYIVLLLYMGLYLAYDTFFLTKRSITKFLKVFSYIVLILFTLIVFLNLPVTKAVWDKYLGNRIYVMLHFQTAGMTGSNERLYQVAYGLSQSACWFFGKGFGTAKFIQADAHGFLHFGISSMGGYIILLGVWFFVFYTIMYSKILSLLTFYKHGKKAIRIVTFIIMVLFSMYIPVYNDARSVILIGLYSSIFRYMAYENERRVENRNLVREKQHSRKILSDEYC